MPEKQNAGTKQPKQAPAQTTEASAGIKQPKQTPAPNNRSKRRHKQPKQAPAQTTEASAGSFCTVEARRASCRTAAL
jgi:hypothetical protein